VFLIVSAINEGWLVIKKIRRRIINLSWIKKCWTRGPKMLDKTRRTALFLSTFILLFVKGIPSTKNMPFDIFFFRPLKKVDPRLLVSLFFSAKR
jgi:hypothetical protein